MHKPYTIYFFGITETAPGDSASIRSTKFDRSFIAEKLVVDETAWDILNLQDLICEHRFGSGSNSLVVNVKNKSRTPAFFQARLVGKEIAPVN